jgi:hypothetical protein
VFHLSESQTVADPDPRQLRLNHFCLWVEDVEGFEKCAATAGRPFTGPIGQNNSRVQAAIEVGRAADPDGKRVEPPGWTGPARV